MLGNSHSREFLDTILCFRYLDLRYGRTEKKVNYQHQSHEHIQTFLSHSRVRFGLLLVESLPASHAKQTPILQKAERSKSFRKCFPIIGGGASGLREEGTSKSAPMARGYHLGNEFIELASECSTAALIDNGQVADIPHP